MKNKRLKPLSFKKVPQIKNKFEDVIDLSVNNDDNLPSYSEEDFGLVDEPSFQREPREDSGVKILKINYLSILKQIKPDYKFSILTKPRRNLTSPHEPVSNNNKDNAENNLIVYFEDEINGYVVIDIIGQGVSSQVFKVKCLQDDNFYALKIIKNRRAYKNQSLIELKILTTLNQKVDKDDIYHIMRVHDYFFYYEHLCIIFELFSQNLYQLLQHNLMQGLSLNSIRFVTKQILEATEQIHNANIIHCDLKPENILLKYIKENNNKSEISIKVTDFGSACDKNNPMISYIQSRFYRAPEVILGLPYTNAIDIWSIGLIAIELYLGNPLLPGTCEFDQLVKIKKVFGDMPYYMLNNKKCRNLQKYYVYNQDLKIYTLKNVDDYFKDNPNDLYDEEYKIPFDIKSLDDLTKLKRDSKIKKFNDNNSSNNGNNSSGMNDDIYCFVHFLKCMLSLDPKSRWTASQCLRHPFITKEKFDTFLQSSHFPLEDTTSQQYLYLSNNNINCDNPRMNNSFNSMGYNIMSYDGYNTNNPNNNSSSFCFQPNLNNIHLNWMRNFPFAMVDQCNLKGSPQCNRNNFNRTFMMTSFEQLNMNNSMNNISCNNNLNLNSNNNNGNNSFIYNNSNNNSFIYNNNSNINCNNNNNNNYGRFSNEFNTNKMRSRQKSLFSTKDNFIFNTGGDRNSIGISNINPNMCINNYGGGGQQSKFMRRNNKRGKTIQYSTLWSNTRNNKHFNNGNEGNFIFINNNNSYNNI